VERAKQAWGDLRVVLVYDRWAARSHKSSPGAGAWQAKGMYESTRRVSSSDSLKCAPRVSCVSRPIHTAFFIRVVHFASSFGIIVLKKLVTKLVEFLIGLCALRIESYWIVNSRLVFANESKDFQFTMWSYVRARYELSFFIIRDLWQISVS
jgi:hypothetical protein